jgi:cytochrome oxidase assembly protein ShyY1
MGWRFAFNRRWLGYLGVAIAFALACVLLSQWQFARRDEAVAEVNRVLDNYEATPVAVGDALPDLDSFDEDDKWLPVTMQGEYLVDEQLLVRNRPYNGRPGFEVLTPLRLTDGSVFIVDRGWIQAGDSQDSPDAVPSPPDGPVTVVARLKASEPGITGRSAPAGQVATIELPLVADQIGGDVYTGAYGLLATESTSVAAMPYPAIKPQPDEGPHLSYAIQWIVFALFGFFGLAYALRQEYRLVNADDPEERAKAAIRRAKAANRKKTDADIEDELIDAR